ncbi:hypothetical protein Dimus_032836 [Dionaea muscipula]
MRGGALTLLHSHLTFSSSFHFFLHFLLYPLLVTSSDTLNSSSSLTINDTLVSAGQKFELGFFSDDKQRNWYAGIWYKNLPTKTVVWVANRESPVVSTSSATLKLGDHGNIVIFEQDTRLTWSTNHSRAASNPVIQLLDDGNLVVREVLDESPERYIWQSFDNPSDTLLPGQKQGWNLKTGLDRYLTSWRGQDDPALGAFTFKIDPHGDPEVYMWSRGRGERNRIVYRSGPWVGTRFSGVPEMKSTSVFNFTFVDHGDEVYYMFEVLDNSVKSRLMVDSTGVLRRYTWTPDTGKWNLFWYSPDDQCDDYNLCGPFGACNASALLVCQCLQGFLPKNQQAWGLRDWSDGCTRKTELECASDGFLLMENMKLPQSSKAFVNTSMSIEECEDLCRINCSCTAYADAQFVAGVGSGCVIWTGDLIDLRNFVQGGQNLYIRLASYDLGGTTSTRNSFNNWKKVILGVSIAFGFGILLAVGCFAWGRNKLKAIHGRMLSSNGARSGATDRSQDFLLSFTGLSSKRDYSGERNTDDLELPLFDFGTILMATDNFSDENKLGAGGFGCVYKGVLAEGQEVAIKRLSKDSGQGSEQFRNEVQLIAKLQHRNLVRLVGCCVQMEEKMLLYEYLPNRSLDSIIFSKERSLVLDWHRRFNIIRGIARGMLYLHRDSIFRIIHRDLKASNVLLDAELNPKISDFGMARLFGGEETESNNTRRVVGTYGYMSPEYAMDGIFSVKSDVFSFGVLVLEIVAGKRNRGFFNADNEVNLLGHAWKLWREGRGSELLDPVVGAAFVEEEVIRCIQVGLLCVQECADDRPTMATVLIMLDSESLSMMPLPKLPGFCFGLKTAETEYSSSSKQLDESCTINQVTVTTLDAR